MCVSLSVIGTRKNQGSLCIPIPHSVRRTDLLLSLLDSHGSGKELLQKSIFLWVLISPLRASIRFSASTPLSLDSMSKDRVLTGPVVGQSPFCFGLHRLYSYILPTLEGILPNASLARKL